MADHHVGREAHEDAVGDAEDEVGGQREKVDRLDSRADLPFRCFEQQQRRDLRHVRRGAVACGAAVGIEPVDDLDRGPLVAAASSSLGLR